MLNRPHDLGGCLARLGNIPGLKLTTAMPVREQHGRDISHHRPLPPDAVVYPPVAASWLAQRAVAAGAQLRCGVEVRAIGDGDVLLADGSRLRARHVIVANGCAVPELLAGVPVRKRKGHLLITTRARPAVNHQLVELGYMQSAHGGDGESVAFRQDGDELIIEAPDRVRILIWERGVGPTHASGTGACASAIAAIAHGGAVRDVQVMAPGGTQRVEWTAEGVFLTGWAEVVIDGHWVPSLADLA